MVDIDAILDGDAGFPFVGMPVTFHEQVFAAYAERCHRISRVIDSNNDGEDYEQEIIRQNAMKTLIPSMEVIAHMLLTQDATMMFDLFNRYIVADRDVLRFFELLRQQNPQVNGFINRF